MPGRVELVAQTASAIPLFDKIKEHILNPAITLLFFLAFLYFVYGVVQFIRHSDSEDGREDGQRHIMWGAIGMFIMISAYGIINLICNTVYCHG